MTSRGDGSGGRAGPRAAGAVRFLGPTFAVGWGVVTALWAVAAAQPGGRPPRGEEEAAAIVLMCVPGCVFLALRLLRAVPAVEGMLSPPPIRILLAAFLLPLAYAGISAAVSWALGLTRFIAPPGVGTGFLLALSLTALPLLVLPLAFLEELGWRGFLVPQLAVLGARRAALLSAALWALWRLPLDVVEKPGGRPAWAVGLAGFAATFLFGVVLAWLRLRGSALWPPALAHALLFAQMAGPLGLLARSDPLLGGPRGLVGGLVLTALCAWLLAAGRWTGPAWEEAGREGSAVE